MTEDFHQIGKVVPFPVARNGSAAARLEPLFREQRPRLIQFLAMRLGSRGDAEDAAQLLFLRLWQRRETLVEDNLVALMFVTARNIATDLQRERKRRRALSADELGDWDRAIEVKDESHSPERSAAARQFINLIPRLLDELPPKCRAAFVSYKFENMSYCEIAASMNLTESMVRKYVLKALAHCSARFERMEGWE